MKGGDMREREPMTQTIKASEARQGFSQLLNTVFRDKTRVLVERSGIPVAAIISAKDLERLTQLEAEREQHFRVLDRIRAKNPDADPDEVLEEVTKEVEAVRQAGYDRTSATPGSR